MEELREDHDDGTVARVAAIDIAKASGMVCLRVPHDTIDGRRMQQVWNVASTTNAILELGDKLVCQGVERVVMEATGSYWRPFFYLLEARGLDCWLVNARDVKNVPGRPKTDKLDAVWLAKLAERGMVRASFVPPKPVRQLRDFTRVPHPCCTRGGSWLRVHRSAGGPVPTALTYIWQQDSLIRPRRS
ncbi:IS110 family transposase [Streptomyces geranii]|uniref:IS110 family transposase n=1 Tax=Streptomyces geranii TaxID=2058923 RepID=UPI0018E53375